MPKPLVVPPTYAPNLSLPWAQRASYIWALHPADVVRCDKGDGPLTANTGNLLSQKWDTYNWLHVHTLDAYWESSPFQLGAIPADAAKSAFGIALWWIRTPDEDGEDEPTGLAAAGTWDFISPPRMVGLQDTSTDKTTGGAVKGSIGTHSVAYDNLHGPLATKTGDAHHLVFQYRPAGEVEMWIDGVLQAGYPATVSPRAIPVSPFKIAGGFDANGEFGPSPVGARAAIRLVAVCSGTNWTPEEIQAMYNKPGEYYIYTGPLRPTPPLNYQLLYQELLADPSALGLAPLLAAQQYELVAQKMNFLDEDFPEEADQVLYNDWTGCIDAGEFRSFEVQEQMVGLRFLLMPLRAGDRMSFAELNPNEYRRAVFSGKFTTLNAWNQIDERPTSRSERYQAAHLSDSRSPISYMDITYAWVTHGGTIA